MKNFILRKSDIFKVMMGLCLTSFSLLTAKVIHVNEGEDLQQTINAADAGDTLKLRGTFIGSFIIDKSLTLEGRKKPAILDGNGTGGVLTIIGQSASAIDQVSVNLKNLIIRNGQAQNGGGILNQFAKLKLDLVTIKNNQATSTGGGIASILGELHIKRSTIKNNSAANGGGGINSLSNTVSLNHSSIINNIAQNGSGGGIVANTSIIDIKHTRILRNQALDFFSVGGGIDNEAGSTITISKQCKIKKNKANAGGGIYNAATLTIKDSLILENHALPSSTGIQSKGGGLFNAFTGTTTLINSTIEFNEAGSSTNLGSGGGVFNNNGQIDLETTRIKHNLPDNIAHP